MHHTSTAEKVARGKRKSKGTDKINGGGKTFVWEERGVILRGVGGLYPVQ